MPATQHAVISGRGTMIRVLPNNRRLWQQGQGRGTIISVLPNNRRLWQQGEAAAMPATQHAVISGRGGSWVSGILG